jgi:hypothetical protein
MRVASVTAAAGRMIAARLLIWRTRDELDRLRVKSEIHVTASKAIRQNVRFDTISPVVHSGMISVFHSKRFRR